GSRALRPGVLPLGRPGDWRAQAGRSGPGAAAGRLRGGRAPPGGLPARPGRRAGPPALRVTMPEIRNTDWAYAAGFVDGEGCIAITRTFVPSRGKYTYSVAVVVVNRDRAVLDWMR